MKKFLSVVVIVGILIVLVGAIVGFVLFSKKDELARRATERALTFVLQTECKVGGAALDVRAGTIEFTDISIANPPGYDSSHAMKFGLVRVEADIASFRTNEPTVRLVRITESDIILDRKVSSSNLQDLMANAGRFSSQEKKESEKAMKIEKVLVEGTTVRVALPLSGGRTIGVGVPDIEMNDIGGQKDKVTPAEALQEFLGRILAAIGSAGSGILPNDLLSGIGDSLKGLPGDLQSRLGELPGSVGDAVSGAGRELEKVGDTVGGAVGDAARSVEGAVGGLLGRRRSSED